MLFLGRRALCILQWNVHCSTLSQCNRFWHTHGWVFWIAPFSNPRWWELPIGRWRAAGRCRAFYGSRCHVHVAHVGQVGTTVAVDSWQAHVLARLASRSKVSVRTLLSRNRTYRALELQLRMLRFPGTAGLCWIDTWFLAGALAMLLQSKGIPLSFYFLSTSSWFQSNPFANVNSLAHVSFLDACTVLFVSSAYFFCCFGSGS